MKLLFIGGTGIISSACVRLAARRGHQVHLLNRGRRELNLCDLPGVTIHHADIRQPDTVAAAIGDHRFDVVADFIAFTPDHIETDLALFRDRVDKQYLFISSASVYQKPLKHYLITEDTPLDNPFWEYSRNKITCELRLMRAWRDEQFPVTIVRPSHTYNEQYLPTAVGSGPTVVARMRAGKPVIVHGDGQSLWVLTHNTDFAQAFIGLLGRPEALGQAYHITSDEVLNWDTIYQQIADAAGVPADRLRLIHLPSDYLTLFSPDRRGSLLGDKAVSVVFDNSKIKSLVPGYAASGGGVPFAEGARQAVAWMDADPIRARPDPAQDAAMDQMIACWEKALPQ
ncbi:MAG: SDR family oxidoreductase [Phycisphaeraceae bacterium]